MKGGFKRWQLTDRVSENRKIGTVVTMRRDSTLIKTRAPHDGPDVFVTRSHFQVNDFKASSDIGDANEFQRVAVRYVVQGEKGLLKPSNGRLNFTCVSRILSESNYWPCLSDKARLFWLIRYWLVAFVSIGGIRRDPDDAGEANFRRK